MSRRGHVPIRMCVGCGERSSQAELVRVVREETGRLIIDAARRRGGRGGYLHSMMGCWVRFARRKGTVRSFRMAVSGAARAALLTKLQRGDDR